MAWPGRLSFCPPGQIDTRCPQRRQDLRPRRRSRPPQAAQPPPKTHQRHGARHAPRRYARVERSIAPSAPPPPKTGPPTHPSERSTRYRRAAGLSAASHSPSTQHARHHPQPRARSHSQVTPLSPRSRVTLGHTPRRTQQGLPDLAALRTHPEAGGIAARIHAPDRRHRPSTAKCRNLPSHSPRPGVYVAHHAPRAPPPRP